MFFKQTHPDGPWQKKPKHTLSGLKTFAKHAFLGLQIFAIKNDIKHATLLGLQIVAKHTL